MGNFSISGEFLTLRIRDLWDSKEYKKALRFGLESLHGSSIQHIVEIIDGKSKLVGVNDVELVDDGEFEPHVTFEDILDYAMIPNNRYFRIYDEDTYRAKKIINEFTNTPPTSYGDEKRRNLIYEWYELLPEIRNDYKNQIPHWMSVYLRRESDDYDVTKKASFYSINLVESEIGHKLKEDFNRKEFDSVCDKFHIYSDREETWEECLNNRKMVTIPPKEKIEEDIRIAYKSYKHDISMKSDYGWLSPDGRFTVCKWAEHEVLASIMCDYFKYSYTDEQKIGNQLSDVLLKKGYVKIHRDDTGFLHFSHERNLTPEQEMKIDRYKHVHHLKKN